ncbi:MAG: hypothetical protein HUJ53_09085 [Holdemanella sp.]|nr:hypothetical protein [Holdemanella sp.]
MENEMITKDELILLRAKKKVKFRCIWAFLIVMVMHTLLFAGYYLGYLTSNISNIKLIIALMACSELCLFGINGVLLGFGSKVFRFLYWIVPIYSLASLYIPIRYMLMDFPNIVSYILWIMTYMVKFFYLVHFGNTLKTSGSSRASLPNRSLMSS